MSSATIQPQTVELNKKTATQFLRQLIEKGQEAGHYTLKDGHILFEAIRFLENEDGESSLDLKEPQAFEILLNAIQIAQNKGHCYNLETASNAFRVMLYVTENFIKIKETSTTADNTTDNSTDTAEEGPSVTKSRLPHKKAV